MTAPLTAAASSEHSQRICLAIDSGATHFAKSALGIAARLPGVSIVLAMMTLAVTPLPLYFERDGLHERVQACF